MSDSDHQSDIRAMEISLRNFYITKIKGKVVLRKQYRITLVPHCS